MAMNDLNESVNGSVKLITYPNSDVRITRNVPGLGNQSIELPAADARWIAERIIADHAARNPKTRTSSDSFEVKAGGLS